MSDASARPSSGAEEPGTSGRYLTVDFDSITPSHRIGDNWQWSNSIAASVSTPRVEGMARAEWIRQLGEALAEDPSFLWGAAYQCREFEASDLDTTHGLRAIGRDASKHLPGLYWLNFFGSPYTSIMAMIAAPGERHGLSTLASSALICRCPLGHADERWVARLPVSTRLGPCACT